MTKNTHEEKQNHTSRAYSFETQRHFLLNHFVSLVNGPDLRRPFILEDWCIHLHEEGRPGTENTNKNVECNQSRTSKET